MFGNHKRFSSSVLVVACLFFLSAFTAHAVLKDTDIDGITDEAEVNVYRTDPNNHDTDGDGFGDGYEVANKFNPLDAMNAPLIARAQDVSVVENIFTLNRTILMFIASAIIISCFFAFRFYTYPKKSL